MRTKTIKLYQFAELSDDAKERALDACRDWNVQDSFWHEHYTEKGGDFYTIAGILGIELDRVMFSGFWSQGDGARFTGTYYYAKGASKAIREHAPEDKELHAIADTLQDVQRRNFYQLSARIEHRSPHYVHEMTASIDVYRDEYATMTDDAEETVTEALRDLMRWLYRVLEKEYEYQTTDDAVRDTIEANELEFTEDGALA